MTESSNVPELEELEPLEELAPAPADAGQALAEAAPRASGPQHVVMSSGLPAPFYSRTASKEWYRFLFAGVLIAMGCLMPFGPQWEMAGYKTFSGGLFFIIGGGLIWTAWGAISHGRPPTMKFIGLAFLPFVWGIFKLVSAWDEPAVAAFAAEGGKLVTDWGDLFSTLVDREDPDRFVKIGNFLRYFGPGKLFVFFGAFLVELYFVLGIVGGAKKIKQDKAARSSGRRR